MVLALLERRKTQTRRTLIGKSGRPVPLASVRPGDQLWVREALVCDMASEPGLTYGADGAPVPPEIAPIDFVITSGKMPAMFMPRWASRLTLLVEAVRAERLHEITEADAEAEGIGEPYLGDADPPFEEQAIMVSRRQQYRNLWYRLNGEKSWDANPEVLVLSFAVREGNIDRGFAG